MNWALENIVVPALLVFIVTHTNLDRVRRWLSKLSGGLFRRLYIRAFVKAIRGWAATTETMLLALIPIGVLTIAGIELKNRDSDLKLLRMEIEDRLERVAPVDSNREPGDSIPALREGLAAATDGIDRARLARNFLGGFTAFLLLFWFPSVSISRRFAHELDRFVLRIQGLASREELARLALLESQVRDEKSLRLFVESAMEIARQHGLERLTETFKLWSSPDKVAGAL